MIALGCVRLRGHRGGQRLLLLGEATPGVGRGLPRMADDVDGTHGLLATVHSEQVAERVVVEAERRRGAEPRGARREP